MNDACGREASPDAGIRVTTSAPPKVLIVGCSGHARVVVDILELQGRYEIVGLIDSFKPAGTQLRGYEVIGTEEDIPTLVEAGVASLGIIAIGDNWTRARVVTRIRELQPDFQFITAIHPNVCVARDVEIGEGTVVMAGAVVNTGARIEAFCILNTRCSVDHECTLGEFSSIAPGVVIGGRVTVGPFAAVGIGATIIHEVSIGKHTVVGAGAIVVKDVPDHVVVYGTPARFVRSRQAGEPYLVNPTKLKTSAAEPIPAPPTVLKSSPLQLFSTDDAEWTRYLSELPHDFFHTREYHKAWTEMRGGEGRLAVYGRSGKFIAWPYVLQAIGGSLCSSGTPAYDVTSAYGFGGPLAVGCDNDPDFLRCAWKALLEMWHSQSIVTVFTRFHPILTNYVWTEHMYRATNSGGGIVGQGQTVAIDLMKSEQETWSGYKRQLRQAIRRGLQANVRVAHDPEWRHLGDFKRLYYATMKRNEAGMFYYFTASFFDHLKDAAGPHGSLMVALCGDTVISAALLLEFGAIVNVFLLGSDVAYSSLSPSKLLFHYAQAWGRERGNRYLHLGGGRGNRDADELFRFKRLFSHDMFPFYTARWILDQHRHDALLQQRLRDARLCGDGMGIAEDYFPAYRAPFTRPVLEHLQQ